MIILVNVNGFSPNVVCALIFWRSAFRLLISEFRQLLATRPYFHIWTISLVNINGFSPNLVCALILWTTAFRLLMNEFRPFLTELSARNASVFYFQDNNLSKSQWIFIKFNMSIDIVEICFGVAHWQISSVFDSYLPTT